VEPAIVDFGLVELGNTTTGETLKILSPAATRVHVNLRDTALHRFELVEPKTPIALTAGEEKRIKIRVKVASDSPAGELSGTLSVISENGAAPGVFIPASVALRMRAVRLPVWRKILHWLVIGLILGLIALAATCLVKGETPVGLLKTLAERKQLEGEFELLRPRPASFEDGFIRLGDLKRRHASLSALAIGAWTDGSDADLNTIFRNGTKVIQLTRTEGQIRVNDQEIATSDIYDGDIIEIGETRLRFNWTGHERLMIAEEE
jgi:hypothetical protein